MKKIIIPIITLIFITCLTYFLLSLNTTKDVTSKAEIDVIRQDSKLDILINLDNYSLENYSNKKLLDVAMQYTEKLDLIKETTTDNIYIQYANKNIVHNLIYELTGILIDSPIIIDDFYYQYDTENEYYYYLGASPSYYEISEIKNVKRTKNLYHINCSITKNEDGEIILKDNVYIELVFKPENSIIKYQIQKISIN